MTWILSAFADEAADSIDGQIKSLSDAGLKHLDPRSVEGYNIAALPLEIAQTIKSKLDAAGIQVNMFGSPIGKIDIAEDFNEDLDKLRHLGELSPILGCNQVRIFSYYNKHARTPERWQEESLERLSRLRDLAGELDLVLFHENERDIFGDHCEQNLVLANRLRDGETFKLIFDFDNYNHSDEDAWDNWNKLKNVTDAFHLKDSDKQCQHVPVGQGVGHIEQILTDALASGWTGPLSLEPHLKHSPAVMATHVGGSENRRLASLSEAECFHIAADAAKEMLGQIGAAYC